MPNNWKKYKLGEIASLRKQNIQPKDFTNEIYIGLEHIGQGNFLLDGLGVASDVTSNKATFNSGDILYGKIRPYFKKVYRPKFSGICSTDILVVFSRNENLVDQNYLYQIIKTQSFTDKATETSTGTKMPRADWDSLCQIEFVIPPLKEQQAIAEILSALDDKIEINLQTNKTLEEMANALYKHWFVDFGPFKNGNFVESELGLLPEGFKIMTFKDACFNRSKTFDFKGKEKVIFINTGDILEGQFLHKNYSDVETLPGQAKKVIETEDILFSEIRPGNKRYALILFDSSEYVVSTKFMVIRAKETILPRILYRIIRDETVIKEFQNIAESRSGTFPQITFDAISHVNFPMAGIEIQKKFMDKVLPLESLIESNNLEIEQLKQTRDYLLPKLISGEVRVKEAEQTLKEIL